ncbi:MAG: hypothetical protein VCB59_02875, partial [Gammaproteobacteria bacterium]
EANQHGEKILELADWRIAINQALTIYGTQRTCEQLGNICSLFSLAWWERLVKAQSGRVHHPT